MTKLHYTRYVFDLKLHVNRNSWVFAVNVELVSTIIILSRVDSLLHSIGFLEVAKVKYTRTNLYDVCLKKKKKKKSTTYAAGSVSFFITLATISHD